MLVFYILEILYIYYIYEELFHEWNLIDCQSCVWIFEFGINK